MFEMVETLVSGLRGMAQQHDLFADLLRTTDYMKLFASRHKENENPRVEEVKPIYPLLMRRLKPLVSW
ncbi:hypothetical protein AAG906_021687 [Vitis piasezkii]